MTSAAEARVAMLAAIAPLGDETVSLQGALGRTLAAPIRAHRAQPPFAASAMDGYALRAVDTPGRLRIAGESAAGHAFPHALAPGEAVRISTGAPLPEGADAVLIQEEARIEADMLIAEAVSEGRHVRPSGIDFKAGATVLEAGRRLDPVAVALAAAAGAADVQAVRRPRVTILCAGDEVVAPGRSPRADQIFESCSYVIAAQIEQWGGHPTRHSALPDNPTEIERASAVAVEASDLVVFIGSASVGPHDHAKPAFEKLGARFLVRKVDMRPGKPTWFATTASAPVLGLPGNPASAIVASVLFLKPLLERMQGGSGEIRVTHARLAAPLPANGAREAYLRAKVRADEHGQLLIDASHDQDSSLLSVCARSTALLIRGAGAASAPAGSLAQFIDLGTQE